MAERYFGNWADYAELLADFESSDKRGSRAYREAFPSDDQILFASYGGADYEGDALVLFERDGHLYEVNGGHCSCTGLEDQWDPEQTTWQALAMRKLTDHDADAVAALKALVKSRLAEQVTG